MLLGRYTPCKIAGGNASSLNSAQTCRNLRKSRQRAVSYLSTEKNQHLVAQKLLDSERFLPDEGTDVIAALTPPTFQRHNAVK